MKFLEKHPMYMIATGVVGISLSAIIVKYSDAPSLITAVYRLFFTVAMMTPVVFLNRSFRMELSRVSLRTVVLCAVSGIFLALHFVSWFESHKNLESVHKASKKERGRSGHFGQGEDQLLKGAILSNTA